MRELLPGKDLVGPGVPAGLVAEGDGLVPVLSHHEHIAERKPKHNFLSRMLDRIQNIELKIVTDSTD
jgi:hypothetical protein